MAKQTQLVLGRNVSGISPSGLRLPNSNNPSTKSYNNTQRLHNSFIKRGNKSDGNYVKSDPDRFTLQGQETRKLMENMKGKYYDIHSFKVALNDAWGKDSSLKNLLESMDTDDYKALFNTEYIQKNIIKDTEIRAKAYLARKLNINQDKAGILLKKMTPARYQKFVNNVNRYDKGYELAVSYMETKPQTKAFGIATGKIRPPKQRWTKEQLMFLDNYQGFTAKQITPKYNQYFKNQRTQNSIYFKIYRTNKTKTKSI